MPYQDLSQLMHPAMSVWPGDAQPRFDASCTLEDGNCRSTLISFTTHTGTHVDAFSHIVPEGETMEAIPADRFFGGAVVVDCRGLPRASAIGPEIVKATPGIEEARIVLLLTGWDRYYNTREYEAGFPFIGEELAHWLVERGVSAMGVDALSIDPTESWEMPAHQILMAGGVLIYENLCCLDKISVPIFDFYGLPLRLEGLDASPVRALAVW